MPRTTTIGYRAVPLDQLTVSPLNVRHRELNEDISELAASMDQYGQQQPIVVQQVALNRYEIIIGQRRFLAAQQLGWESIDARIIDQLEDLDAVVISLSENVARRDLAPRDKAAACEYLYRELKTIRAVARRLGMSEPTVRKWLGYAAVPAPLREMVDAREISVPTAMTIAQQIPDTHKAVALARRVADMKATPEQRSRIFAAVEEAPDRPVEAILRRAEEKRQEKRIVIILPEKAGRALERAARTLRAADSEVARTAVIEWLEERRF